MEDDRGRSTADTFNNIKKMELGASTIVTSGTITSSRAAADDREIDSFDCFVF